MHGHVMGEWNEVNAVKGSDCFLPEFFAANGEKRLINADIPLRPGCEKQAFETVRIPGRGNYFWR